MKILVIFSILLRMVFAISGAYLCYNGTDGWGWFLFGAIACSVNYTNQQGEEKIEE